MRTRFVPLAVMLVLAVAACGGSGHRQSQQQIRRGGASGAIREIQVARGSRRFFAIFPRHPASAPCTIGGATRRIPARCSTRVHYLPDGKSSVFFTLHAYVRNAPVIHVRVTVAGGKVLSVAAPKHFPGQGPFLAAWSASPVPRWAAKCLPKGGQRLGVAPSYVGLTFAAAQRRVNSPVFAGGGGRCASFDDDVLRTHPIAVVYNTWDVHQRRARIVAAVRAVAGWQPGQVRNQASVQQHTTLPAPLVKLIHSFSKDSSVAANRVEVYGPGSRRALVEASSGDLVQKIAAERNGFYLIVLHGHFVAGSHPAGTKAPRGTVETQVWSAKEGVTDTGISNRLPAAVYRLKGPTLVAVG